MQILPFQITLPINDGIFQKDPESSALGRKIVAESIAMIDEMGFEHFTFRKLGERIGSPEASIYRYFDNKHRLLLYLITWYWNWLDVRLLYTTANINDPHDKLRRAIRLLTGPSVQDNDVRHVDEEALHRIVISESSKTYLTKEVDMENSEGFFHPYNQLVERIAEFILELNPSYRYPHMLVSTVIEGAHLQRFFAQHLPRLTDQLNGEDSVVTFYEELVFHAISGVHA